ncbi:restriction endonuclease subunit S [uncultured Thiocystis sp.]|uniref:restriction endonuclease subunit S n=1 Tax=uncultured Thiocystis sp. TaxID=1202134 RepID=UPI0025D9094A|nr:restriction endonuclease subunit S [uncultured Thiocystis sp.]
MIPKDWEKKPISEFGQIQGGRQRSPKAKGKLRQYLRVANVFDGYIDTSDVLEMPFTDAEHLRFRLRTGDILLNEGQSLELVGRPAMYKGKPPDCCYQNTLIRFRPGHHIDGNFALKVFQYCHHTGKFSAIASRTTSIAHLGVERFAGLPIPVPKSIAEQQKITEAIDYWDRALSITERLIAAKLKQRKGLMQELLTGKRRFPRFSEPWREVHLGAVTTESLDRNSGRLGRESVRAVTNSAGMIPMRAQTIAGVLDRYMVVEPRAFAYNPMRINVGSLCKWPGDEPCLVSPDYVVFNCKAGELDADYFDYLRHTHRWDHSMQAAGNGSVRVRIYYDDLASLRYVIPPLPEQVRISTFLRSLDRELSLLRAQLAALKTQKRGLMQQLLTGRVRVCLPAVSQAALACPEEPA